MDGRGARYIVRRFLRTAHRSPDRRHTRLPVVLCGRRRLAKPKFVRMRGEDEKEGREGHGRYFSHEIWKRGSVHGTSCFTSVSYGFELLLNNPLWCEGRAGGCCDDVIAAPLSFMASSSPLLSTPACSMTVHALHSWLNITLHYKFGLGGFGVIVKTSCPFSAWYHPTSVDGFCSAVVSCHSCAFHCTDGERDRKMPSGPSERAQRFMEDGGNYRRKRERRAGEGNDPVGREDRAENSPTEPTSNAVQTTAT